MRKTKLTKGTKVVCVNDADQWNVDENQLLVKGELYTVREVVVFDGEPTGLRLEELRLDEGKNGYGERSYNAARFEVWVANDQDVPRR